MSEELNRYRAVADEALTSECENDDLRHAVQAARDWLNDEICGLAARYDDDSALNCWVRSEDEPPLLLLGDQAAEVRWWRPG